ncbi:hypothetical protein GOP47_0004650 [Adiantum capillus-veneris]|uniref:Uncharacterized protein n=1 Tax=Adiantum capillus-veneris TaxID=13818 RepID=A0A9D4V8G3_ADICA|nr:hypothetical protein GOP47_0004650 [Adiantum capillus-veneris]
MELASVALQGSQRLITTWQTPLLFVLVQVLIVLIYLKETSSSSGHAEQQEEERQRQQQQQDFWDSMFSVPTQLTRLPSFVSRSSASSLTSAAALVVGLRTWARQASSRSHAPL